MNKKLLSIFCTISTIGLISCASNPVSVQQQQRSVSDHDERARDYTLTEACYKKGYFDGDLAAKGNMALDFMTEIGNYDKSYIANRVVSYRNMVAQNPSLVSKDSCQNMEMLLRQSILVIDQANANKRESDRNNAIRNSHSSSTSFPTVPTFPKIVTTTNCTNLGFGMTSCTSF